MLGRKKAKSKPSTRRGDCILGYASKRHFYLSQKYMQVLPVPVQIKPEANWPLIVYHFTYPRVSEAVHRLKYSFSRH